MRPHDEFYMREALLEAKKAFERGEVPVGAVLVKEGKIIASAHNLVESFSDASCHAELLCLKKGGEILGNWRLLQTTLYSTLEPCPMCAGALALFRVKKVVYGARDHRYGADGTMFDVLNRPHPIHQIEVLGGVCEKEAAEMIQQFFKERRSGKIIRNT